MHCTLRFQESRNHSNTMALIKISKNDIAEGYCVDSKTMGLHPAFALCNCSHGLTWHSRTMQNSQFTPLNRTSHYGMIFPADTTPLHLKTKMLSFSEPSQCINSRLDDKSTGRMSTATYQELYRRNCIQSVSLRPVDLLNPIHDIFRRKNFISIKNNEYGRIEPALKLQ
jgi:hypothetical protein